MLQETVDQEIPVPKPPMSWQDTTQDWEVAVRTIMCRPEYPHQQEPRGAKYTEKEATGWQYKLCEYNVRDAIADWRIDDIHHPKNEKHTNTYAVKQNKEEKGYQFYDHYNMVNMMDFHQTVIPQTIQKTRSPQQ
ncbi:hypothetical protein VC83_00589 [Pseudogymnoascus destructans]|uniref:Uncharacterized protein n=1 Tax=Pseudogymnoascus destructans TaxID=655981 RepID=A0A177AMT2_9PEZI|nr:uncharacterized protein VC83_00589 [Pseudogymnoascus destructans]OAF63389.1 hypothetical protein VC83_00589 [Pseudogymnoascus destructans]